METTRMERMSHMSKETIRIHITQESPETPMMLQSNAEQQGIASLDIITSMAKNIFDSLQEEFTAEEQITKRGFLSHLAELYDHFNQPAFDDGFSNFSDISSWKFPVTVDIEEVDLTDQFQLSFSGFDELVHVLDFLLETIAFGIRMVNTYSLENNAPEQYYDQQSFKKMLEAFFYQEDNE